MRLKHEKIYILSYSWGMFVIGDYNPEILSWYNKFHHY